MTKSAHAHAHFTTAVAANSKLSAAVIVFVFSARAQQNQLINSRFGRATISCRSGGTRFSDDPSRIMISASFPNRFAVFTYNVRSVHWLRRAHLHAKIELQHSSNRRMRLCCVCGVRAENFQRFDASHMHTTSNKLLHING